MSLGSEWSFKEVPLPISVKINSKEWLSCKKSIEAKFEVSSKIGKPKWRLKRKNDALILKIKCKFHRNKHEIKTVHNQSLIYSNYKHNPT